jgi:hypothetical protein
MTKIFTAIPLGTHSLWLLIKHVIQIISLFHKSGVHVTNKKSMHMNTAPQNFCRTSLV